MKAPAPAGDTAPVPFLTTQPEVLEREMVPGGRAASAQRPFRQEFLFPF